MRRRLLVSYVLLVLAVLVALEVPVGILASNHDEAVLATQAEREATGLAILVGEDTEHNQVAQLGALVAQYGAQTGGEVTVFGRNGQVVAFSGTNRDRDAASDQGAMVARAMSGHASSRFTFDEGSPVAAAAVPLSVDTKSPGAVLLDVPAGQAVSSAHTTWLLLGLFGLAVLAVCAVVALALARSVSRPLGELEIAVAQLGKGDLSARAIAGGPDEVRSLAEQFNSMADQLSALLESQNRFVTDASHQLRSPLTALRLRLENLEPALDGNAARGLAAAGEEVQRLSRIVDGLLALTRAGSEHPPPGPIDVASVIAQRCDSWEALAEERGLALHLGSVPPGGTVAMWVPGDLDQILDNLLANALDACPAGSSISVRFVPEGPGSANLHVTDNGPGLSTPERDRAFERFWQAPTKSRADTQGAASPTGGLGLAIVRELAIRNRAEVELRAAAGGGLDAVVHFGVRPTSDES